MAAPYAPTHSREGKGRVTLDDALGEPHRLRKTAKQRALDIVLGVPLHRQRPWLAVPRLGGFNHAIGGPGGGDERRREIADRLVVAAVYARLESRERAMQQRARLDPHGVTGPRIGVIDGAAPFTGQVLGQGPSQCDGQDLAAPAEREDRGAAGGDGAAGGNGGAGGEGRGTGPGGWWRRANPPGPRRAGWSCRRRSRCRAAGSRAAAVAIRR